MIPFDSTTLLGFAAAAAILVLIPGPGTAWIVAQSVAGGSRRGVVAGLGLETATLLHASAAGLGLSALLAASAVAFETIKYAGAAYLILLGVLAWRESNSRTVEAADNEGVRETESPPPRIYSLYARSVVTGMLNPKVALFFLAFLPQFVHPERGWIWLQFLTLGAILAIIGFTHSVAIALTIGRLRRRWSISARVARIRQRITGALFVALGLRLALQQRS